ARGAVAAIGNFDGVHLGHRAVIDAARRIAAQRGAKSAVLTFEPHPRRLFRPQDPPFRLTPFRVKALLLDELGVELMLAPKFDRAFASIAAEDFVADVLARKLGLAHVVCGADFVFGRGRGGDVALLKRVAAENGVGVTVVAAVGDGAATYSSTAVRARLQAGDPAGAARALGRPFEIGGRVRRGDGGGRTLGFPTAHVDHRSDLPPRTGVYAVRAALDRKGAPWLMGVANFGARPTVGGARLLLEAHLFDFQEDLYGQRLRVRLIEYLRPERKFDGLDALKAQIAEDAKQARRILGAAGGAPARKAMAS
ncbi:MAG: bifunctional riboflavin kinase/FAD synthetase, partial [Rhodospirillales bacterium]